MHTIQALHEERPRKVVRVAGGFTLIELLVVIAIIALLMSILVPSLRRAKDIANSVKCSSNLKSIGVGFHLYSEDNNGWIFAREGHGDDADAIAAPGYTGDGKKRFYWDPWYAGLAQLPPNHYGWQASIGYVNPDATHCPINGLLAYPDPSYRDSDAQNTPGMYGINNQVLWVKYPSGDWGDWYFRMADAYNPAETYQVCDTRWPCGYMLADLRHMGRHNMLWMDGHAKLTAQNLSAWSGQVGCDWGLRPVYDGPVRTTTVAIDN